MILAADVPEGAVDGADRHHLVPLPAVDGVAVHLVPDTLGGEGVLADQEMTEGAVDRVGGFVLDRTAEAGDAFVGFDLHKTVWMRR